MDNSHILTNAIVVTPAWSGLGTVVVDDGVIVDVLRNRRFRAGSDLRGAWLTPGCLDIHSDYLEKELRPRPSAEFSAQSAFHFLDQRAAASGVTYLATAISFSDNRDNPHRSFENALERAQFLGRLGRQAMIRHVVHARTDPNTPALLSWLDAMAELEGLGLVVYNESIPGQRQFRFEDLVKKRAESKGIPEDQARALLEQAVAERGQHNFRDAIRERLSTKAILGSHDDTTEAHVEEAFACGATLSEMPTTLAAAKRAKALGMWVCMGAPNLVRGGSHCGNLACSEALEAKAVDMLCSDYHLPSMLAAVVKLLQQDVAPSRCFELVSLNPARMLGLADRLGSIELGKEADLIAFSAVADYARVEQLWVAGKEQFRLAPLAA
jgi:alpha-D-ribose 1-methylphosphonate 5-triphosphate diphosphatase